MSAADASSPYKGPSKAEQAHQMRKYLMVPFFAVPLGISVYFTHAKEGSKGFNWFSLHPYMMMTAFFTLPGLSILTKKIGGKENTFLHGYLMTAAAFAAGFGGYVIYTNKEMYNRPHLTTPHGQFGAMIMLGLIGYAVPAYVLYNPENGLLRTNQTARRLHRYSGRLTVACGLITCAFGIMTLETDVYKAGALIVALLITSPSFLL